MVMKRFFFFLMAGTLLAGALVSCNKDNTKIDTSSPMNRTWILSNPWGYTNTYFSKFTKDKAVFITVSPDEENLSSIPYSNRDCWDIQWMSQDAIDVLRATDPRIDLYLDYYQLPKDNLFAYRNIGTRAEYSPDSFQWALFAAVGTNSCWVFFSYSQDADDLDYYKLTSSPTQLTYKDVPVNAVDLGLSVYWGRYNLSSEWPETKKTVGFNEHSAGDYFAWGETETKETYNINTYKYSDNPYTLPLEHDVAHKMLGGKWRLPSEAELKELMEKCKQTLSSDTPKEYYYGANTPGYKRNSITIPLAGYKGTDLQYSGTSGFYWTRERDGEDQTKAKAWYLRQSANPPVVIVSDVRSRGYTIRPVWDPKM